jgi:hypothetical protein
MLQSMWALLIVTLPTQPNAVRLRVWRGLKALGCAALRDGAYLLPQAQSAAFDDIAAEVCAHGGSASVLALAARSDAQQLELLALFDRSEAYARWREGVQSLHGELGRLAETEGRRRLRQLAEALDALQHIDYLPGPALAQSQADLAALRLAVQARFSPGEPTPQSPKRGRRAVPRLDLRIFQNKRWATRARPWVDRLACGWLIRRFIDSRARFVWIAGDAGESNPPRTPRGAIGYDYDGADFTHVGALVTFEVLRLSFGLDADPRLEPIAAAVRFLDAGGIPVPEAAGLERVLAGLREVHADDDALLLAAAAVFDALYAAPGDQS